MNNARRKRINVILDMLKEANGMLETVAEEEQEAYDNMPEGLRDGERGENSSEWLDALENCKLTIEESIDTLEGLMP